MARHCGNVVLLLFTVSFWSLMDVALLANPPPDSPSLYYKESPEGDFGIRMSYDPVKDKALNVIISYDTLTQSASDFFKTQIPAKLIDDFATCNVIAWNFSPCTTTKLVQGGTLSGPKGADQCRFDQVHGCLDDAFNWHQDKMGKFLICVYAENKSTEQCNAQECGLYPEDMAQCVGSARGANSCNSSHNDFVNAKAKPPTKTETDNSAQLPNAITNFKTTTCMILAQINKKCDVVCSSA